MTSRRPFQGIWAALGPGWRRGLAAYLLVIYAAASLGWILVRIGVDPEAVGLLLYAGLHVVALPATLLAAAMGLELDFPMLLALPLANAILIGVMVGLLRRGTA